MTALMQQLKPGARVTGNYLGICDYTGEITDVWRVEDDGRMSFWVRLDKAQHIFGVPRTLICDCINADGTMGDGSTLSVVA